MNTLIPSAGKMHRFGLDCLHQRTETVIVDIRQLRGSAPREVGTVMLVSATEVVGTIGGGHLEYAAISRAKEFIVSSNFDDDFDVQQAYALGPSLGQCCGGNVVLGFKKLTPSNWSAVETSLVQMTNVRFRLHLFGAGHVGAALVNALAPLPCLVNWIDERETLFNEFGEHTQLRANIRMVSVDSPAAEVSNGESGDYYLILTHSHALDLEIAEAVLRRGDAGYIGLIGSQTKKAVFLHRLAQKGIPTEKLHCPIGLPEISGKEPEVIAASIVADLLRRSKPNA
jgi:xanthine dehydrogenase accessory factor